MGETCGCGCGQAGVPVTIEGRPMAEQPMAEMTIAEISRRPGALETLQRLGINHCCGAHLPLREAAGAAGVPVEDVLRALRAAGVPA